MIIPFKQLNKANHSKSQTREKNIGKITARKAKTKLGKVAGKILFGETVVSAQNKGFSVAYHDVKPMQNLSFDIVFNRFMNILSQRGAIAAIIVASYRTAFCNMLFGKFSDGLLLHVLCGFHFQIQGIPFRIQR